MAVIVGVICFIFGFMCGGVFMANSRKEEIKNGFITFNDKLYKVETVDLKDNQ